MLRLVVLLVLVCSCASATTSAWEYPPRRSKVYEPGQSIAEARLCNCDECTDRHCCSGEDETRVVSEHELGMTLSSCGRCTRRVWTVRGTASCAETAVAECCPGTVSD